MKPPIPNIILRLWDAWNLRSCILLSLLLQAFLLFASNRKRTGRKLLLMFIWLAYLLADWIAAVAIGLISKSGGDACDQSKGISQEDFMAFWASFLLLHLGGPDTITSFAVEDNEFWLRHLIGLALQVLATAYIFYQSLPNNKLWVPTALVFVVGTIKYVERTRALFYASVDQFGSSALPEPNPGPDYEETVEIYSSRRSVQISTRVDVMPTPAVGIQAIESTERKVDLEELELLQKAYRLFERFKGLIVGLLLSSKERESSRNFFLERTAKDAFKLIECELSFMYEVLHTKVVVVRCKTGYLLRFLSFSLILGAFAAFFSIEKKDHDRFHETLDITLTYVLFIGALVLELISVLMLIFSDRTLVALKTSRWSKPISAIILKRGRWSKSVSQYDMISYCLNDPPSWVYTLAKKVSAEGVLQMLKILYFSHSKRINDDLKGFIFEQLRLKSSIANNLEAAMEACSQRGDWGLLLNSSYTDLKWSIGDYQYAESLLLWHMATELLLWHMAPKLCYQKFKKPSADNNGRIKISKILSDYMFYLLVMEPAMMAPVLGNWQIVFQDTRAEAKRFFSKKSISNQHQACKEILAVKTPFRPVDVKGNKSKSVFFDACRLAKQLFELKTIDPWVLISRVWVELLSYAAINCRPNVHAQQPSKGGELLTFIWLLMNHLGLGTQFYQQDRQPGTKMVPRK